jgi:hypothetical protein
MELVFLGLVLFAAGFAVGWSRRLAAETVGERAVRERLRSTFQSRNYHLLNNVTLPCPGGTTQVDHILVSRFGVFVIESKHYTGWIFGDAKSRQWTQVVYRTKNQFQNPLHQNYKHCKEVVRLLDFLPEASILPAVVFTGDAEFKSGVPDGVFTLRLLVGHIEAFQTEVMSENRVQFCVGRLECTRLALTQKTDVEHRAALENRFLSKRK